MNKKYFILLAIILFLQTFRAFSFDKIFLIYKGFEYNLIPVSAKEYEAPEINILKEIEEYQRHRILLQTAEKTKLSNLFYTGDKIELNGIELSLVFADIYQIKNLSDKTALKFSLGEKSEIVIKTALNYKISSVLKDYRAVKVDKADLQKSLEFDTMDILASAVYIKELLIKMSLLPEIVKEEKKAVPDVNSALVAEQYEKFIENLSGMDKAEVLKSLTKFVEFNIRTTGNQKVTEKWTNPAALYFYKEGDYKSIALFYYYTFKKIDEINTKKNKPKYQLFNPKAYFLIALEKKKKNEADEVINAFANKYKSIDDLNRIQALEMQYRRVNLNDELRYNPDRPSYSKAQTIYFYKAPELSASSFLVAVTMEDRWMYTTGEKWVNPKASLPERCAAHFSGNGCYYTLIKNDLDLVNNNALKEEDYLWNIFYSTK